MLGRIHGAVSIDTSWVEGLESVLTAVPALPRKHYHTVTNHYMPQLPATAHTKNSNSLRFLVPHPRY